MKIFILLSRVPFPLDKGDKLRAYNFIKHLSVNNDIYLCCLNDTKLQPESIFELQKYCKRIVVYKINYLSIAINLIKALFNGKPFHIGYFYNTKVKRSILNLIDDISPDHILCQLIRTSDYVKDVNINKTLDYQDILSYGIKRRIDRSPFYMQMVLKMEYTRLLNYEHNIFDSFTNKLIISEPDKLLIPHFNNNSIHVLKNGLDHEYYKPIKAEKEFDLLFSGNMAYPPNVDAVVHLINKIIPLVKKEYPNIRVLIAGANPTQKVRSLASKNVVITGWVDDMRECYAKSKIFIAPMRIGTGLQNKLLEAMAMKLPCITTPLANDSLGALDGVEILVGKKIDELSQHICNLMKDISLTTKLSENGCAFVYNKFNWEREIQKLEEIIHNNNSAL